MIFVKKQHRVHLWAPQNLNILSKFRLGEVDVWAFVSEFELNFSMAAKLLTSCMFLILLSLIFSEKARATETKQL